MKKKLKFILLAVLLFILVAGAVFLLFNFKNRAEEKAEGELYEKQLELFSKVKPSLDTQNATLKEHSDAAEQTDNPEPMVDYLAKSRAVNSDIVAWLTIEDTGIDFPVVQTSDNEYYLNHDFEKNSTYMGTPYLDYRNNADFSDFNSIIYGHNISNRYMFYPLLNFKRQDYFDSHTAATITLKDGEYPLEILACAVIKNDDFAYNTVFLSDNEREVFLKMLKEKAACQRDFSIDDVMNKNIITLSTCSYEFYDARTILVCLLDKN